MPVPISRPVEYITAFDASGDLERGFDAGKPASTCLIYNGELFCTLSLQISQSYSWKIAVTAGGVWAG
jgi:hypothetical protein